MVIATVYWRPFFFFFALVVFLLGAWAGLTYCKVIHLSCGWWRQQHLTAAGTVTLLAQRCLPFFFFFTLDSSICVCFCIITYCRKHKLLFFSWSADSGVTFGQDEMCMQVTQGVEVPVKRLVVSCLEHIKQFKERVYSRLLTWRQAFPPDLK